MHRDALLVIDAQVNQFEGEGAVADAPQTLERIKRLVDAAREGGAPVFWVQNDGGPNDPDFPETAGWLLHPELVPREGEPVLRKTTCDVFQSTDIGRRLGDLGVEEVVVCGMQSNWCIRESSRGAVDRGFDLALVVDAHSTMEGGGDGSGRSATEIRRQVNEELWEIGRQLATDEAVARWKTRRTHPDAP